MSTPTPRTDVDLRPPNEDPANAATKQPVEAASNALDAISWPVLLAEEWCAAAARGADLSVEGQ